MTESRRVDDVTSEAAEFIESTDGTTLQVYGCRGGTSALLVHGALGSAADWWPVWVPLRGCDLALVAYDQRGHGGSTVGPKGFSVDAYGDDVRAVADHRDFRAAVAVGHSMGGIALLSYFARFPDEARRRIAALVLVSTSGAGIGRTRDRVLKPLVQHGLLDHVLAQPRVGRAFVRPLFAPRPEPALLELARASLASAPSLAKRNAPISVMEFDLMEQAALIDVPTIVLVGAHDRSTTPDAARHLSAALPDSDLRVLENAGHMLPLERPDAVVTAVKEMVDRSRSARPRDASPNNECEET